MGTITIGALWANESNSGKEYFSGNIEIYGTKVKIIGFWNDNKKRGSREPDIRLCFSKDEEEEGNGRSNNRSRVDSRNGNSRGGRDSGSGGSRGRQTAARENRSDRQGSSRQSEREGRAGDGGYEYEEEELEDPFGDD